MRSIILLAAALAVTACATTNDLYLTEPDEVVLSTKPIDEVSRCMQLQANVPERTNPAGQRIIESRNNFRYILATFTLIPIETGTRIEMRRANGISILGPWRDCL